MIKTQQNLLKAITGESLARNRYTFFAKRARDEGYEGIARIFEETADNERAHAERLLEFLKGEIETSADIGAGPVKVCVTPSLELYSSCSSVGLLEAKRTLAAIAAGLAFLTIEYI